MYLLGYSLNNLSLMALTISTGFVVDDAIVMIENISRYLEEGDDPLEAALKGSEQIGFTIVSLTISLIAVLIPLLFMGDIVGRLFREFAVTLSVTILVSAVVSLTLTPMMCAKLLPPQAGERAERLLPQERRVLRVRDCEVRGRCALGASSPDTDAAGDAGNLPADGLPLHHRAEGILPGAGYGGSAGNHRSSADDQLSGDEHTAAAAGEGDP